DPPAFAQKEEDVKRALKGYSALNYLGMKLAEKLFVTCSCSHHIDRELFKKTVFSSAYRAGKELFIIDYRGQAPDHPVTVGNKHLEYLKCLFAYINKIFN
ncbi:Methyltransferase type 11, partial [Methanocaldococcus villosus KIN24-T80]